MLSFSRSTATCVAPAPCCAISSRALHWTTFSSGSIISSDLLERCTNITSDEFQNFHNPEWLRYVVIAAALDAFGTVPQHCECGHRYDRDCPCLRIGLQPPRHVETGNIGQLHVEQDQVGLVLMGQVDRDLTKSGNHSSVAVVLDHVFEKLEVQFIVFDDEDKPLRRLPGLVACHGEGSRSGICGSPGKLSNLAPFFVKIDY